MADFPVYQGFRYDPRDPATALENSVSQLAHESDTGAAVNKVKTFFQHGMPEGCCGP